MYNPKYEYVTVNVPLSIGSVVSNDSDGKIAIPDGKVVAIGTVNTGNTEGRIINLSVLKNNSEVLKGSDIRFSEKNAGGTFIDSLRPVDFAGGMTYEARLTALAPSSTNDVTVQVLFVIEKPSQY